MGLEVQILDDDTVDMPVLVRPVKVLVLTSLVPGAGFETPIRTQMTTVTDNRQIVDLLRTQRPPIVVFEVVERLAG